MDPAFASLAVSGKTPETSRAISSWVQPFVGAWFLKDFTVGSFQFLFKCTDDTLGLGGARDFRSLAHLSGQKLFLKRVEIQS